MFGGDDRDLSKTPLVLFRFRELLVAVIAGALLLSVAATAGPTFMSANGSAALDSAIEDTNRFIAGFTISQPSDIYECSRESRPGTPCRGDKRLWSEPRDAAITRAFASIDHLGDKTFTMLSTAIEASSEARPDTAYDVRTLYRTGATNHITRLEGAGEGAWVADTVAQSLGLEPGDELVLRSILGRRTTLEVAGIYEALVNARPTPFWSPLYRQIHPPDPDEAPPPPFVIVSSPEVVVETSTSLGERGALFQWDWPIAASQPLTIGQAMETDEGFEAVGERLSNLSGKLGRLFVCSFCSRYGSSNYNWGLHTAVNEARDNVAGLSAPVDLLSLAGTIVALVVVGAAGAYGIHRRRSEATFLFARGMSPATMGVKVAIESALPVAVGAAVGYAAARLLVALLGPGGSVDPATSKATLAGAALTIPAALAVLGTVAAGATARESEVTRSRLRFLKDVPWEVVALIGAGIVFGRIVARGTLLSVGSDGVPRSSAYLLLFPVLFLGGTAGLAARAFKQVVGRVRARADGLPQAAYLAVNRLASASRLAVTLLTASALAIGVFVYAQTMVTSLRATIAAKALIFTGGDVSVQTDPFYDPPESFGFPHTHVHQIVGRAEVHPSGQPVNVMAVDATSLARVARWDSSFGPVDLATNARRLAQNESAEVPVIAVGGFAASELSIAGVVVPVQVIDTPSAFPGIFGRDPWLIVGAEELTGAVAALGAPDPIDQANFSEVWVRGEPGDVVEALGAIGFGEDELLSAEQVLEQPAFLSVTRTFGLLQSLGVIAALLVVVGILLYLQARARGRAVSYALSRRMGLMQRSHLTSLALELGAMILSSALVGCALGIGTAFLIYKRIDPLPATPPSPLLRVPLWVVVPVLLVAMAATLIGALRAQHSAERTDFAEAMRGAI